MNVFANILKVIIILLALAVVVVVLLLGAMVLFPSFSVFGIHYVNGDDKIMYSYYDIEHPDNVERWGSVDTFCIETGSWDVYVYSNEVTKTTHTAKGLDADLTRKYSGFANNNVSVAALSNYVFETKKDGNYLTLSTTEPTGWYSRYDCAVYVYVDVDTLADKTLLIKTNSGKVTIGEEITDRSHTLNIQRLDVVANGGSTVVCDVDVADGVNIQKASGDITIRPSLTCDVKLGISSGLGNISVADVGSETEKSSLVIDKLHNNGVTFKTIYGDLMVNASTGIINGSCVMGNVVFDGVNCSLSLDSVYQKLYFNSVDGSLKVNKNANIVMADVTGSGSVAVSNLNGQSILETTNGSINVKSACADLTARSVNGNITITNGKDCEVDYFVEAGNGLVTVNEINGSINFNTLNNGRAQFHGSFDRLIGNNVVKTYSGEINIDMLDAGYGFLLKEWQTTTTVYFKLSGFEDFSTKKSADNEAYKNGVKIGGYTGTGDTLTVLSTVGKLRVVHPSLI